MQVKKKALGRGLSAILESPETDITSKDISGEFVVGAVAMVATESIEPNPFQPRTFFDETELAELVISIQNQGIIQPITVRKTGYDHYQLIAGERRLKASKVAGLREIPAYIRIANDEQMLELALVENIHRSDLNPLEIAISFQRLIEECQIRQEDLSPRVGKDRSTISNYIRLLKLPAEVQLAIRNSIISMGHARALITLADEKDQLRIMQEIISKKLSVRQVEDLVRNPVKEKKPSKSSADSVLSPKFEQIRESLNKRLNARVEVRISNNGKGSIVIPFRSDEEFDRIASKLES
jgi:ParB family transcriptional regulator, chromosome partitioning protein